MPGLSDTSPDIERMMYQAYRVMPGWRKWRNLVEDYRLARALHAAGVRHRRPGASNRDIQADWIATVWGAPCPIPIPEPVMEPSQQEFQQPLRHTVEALERLGIGYAIGGSIASSLHGASRMTRDADITAELMDDRIEAFVAAFPPAEFYLSPDAVRDAIHTRSTFNILHPSTGYKIDIFVRKDDPFERTAFARRGQYQIAELPGRVVQVHSPEDILLFKLRWFRIGGEISDRQWGDIQGVMRVQADRLDLAYLHKWADEIGVGDLLAKGLAEAGLMPF